MTDPRPQHDAAVSGMFGRIAGFYDLLNHTLSLGIDYYWRHVLAKNVRVGSTNRVLDLAAGTLDVSLAIRRKYPHVQVPAMDFCPPMLQRGLHKLKGDNARAIMPVAALEEERRMLAQRVEALEHQLGDLMTDFDKYVEKAAAAAAARILHEEIRRLMGDQA